MQTMAGDKFPEILEALEAQTKMLSEQMTIVKEVNPKGQIYAKAKGKKLSIGMIILFV